MQKDLGLNLQQRLRPNDLDTVLISVRVMLACRLDVVLRRHSHPIYRRRPLFSAEVLYDENWADLQECNLPNKWDRENSPHNRLTLGHTTGSSVLLPSA